MTVESFGFLFDVFNDLGPHRGRKLGGAEHATNHCCRETGILVVRLKESPGGASVEPKGCGLLVERVEPGGDQSVSDFSDLGPLPCLHCRADGHIPFAKAPHVICKHWFCPICWF